MTTEAAPRARTIARQWWQEHLDGVSEADIKRMAPVAAQELVTDPLFVTQFLDDFLESVLYDIGIKLLAAQRNALRTPALMRETVERDAVRYAADWHRWLEHVPSAKKHLSLPTMSKEQVLEAAEYRLSIAARETREALWLQAIADRLSPGQLVGDVLTDDDLSELRTLA